ncbi:MAG TPA: hypothetical protein VHE12_05710 [bacterium]|nr:hypothetical protein [bacterium]
MPKNWSFYVKLGIIYFCWTSGSTLSRIFREDPDGHWGRALLSLLFFVFSFLFFVYWFTERPNEEKPASVRGLFTIILMLAYWGFGIAMFLMTVGWIWRHL